MQEIEKLLVPAEFLMLPNSITLKFGLLIFSHKPRKLKVSLELSHLIIVIPLPRLFSFGTKSLIHK